MVEKEEKKRGRQRNRDIERKAKERSQAQYVIMKLLNGATLEKCRGSVSSPTAREL